MATVIPYTGYGSEGWLRVLARVVLAKPVPAENAQVRQRKIRGWRSFTTVSLNDAVVAVTVGGQTHEVTADRGGVVDGVVPVDLTPGWHTVTLQAEGAETVEAHVVIVADDVRFGLISDIDDTVMVTSLPRPFLAAWNTFVLDEHARRPVPGMAVFYERILNDHPGAPCFYVSTGAWNVAPTLTRFLRRHIYPGGPLLLTDWGPTHERWFRSGRQHKELALRQLAIEFPKIRWLLVGDDGQHDPDIYDAFAREHPEQVSAIAIRQLSTGEAVLAGGRKSDDEYLDESPVPWYHAPDGAGLVERIMGVDPR